MLPFLLIEPLRYLYSTQRRDLLPRKTYSPQATKSMWLGYGRYKNVRRFRNAVYDAFATESLLKLFEKKREFLLAMFECVHVNLLDCS